MKSQSYPEAVPATYAKHEDTDRAYRMGWNHGHGIACHNVPTLGAKVFSESLGRVTVDADNIREVHESACFEAESNSRQFSPFEFTAAEFNRADSEELNVEGNDEDGYFVFDAANEDEEIETGFETREAAQAWIDARPDSESLWEAFDTGIADAIRADLATYLDADYGIESA